MEVTPCDVEVYATDDGTVPFSDWLHALKDAQGAAKILLRLDRIKRGNLGDYKFIADGVLELRIDTGPGYRVYFAQVSKQAIVILCAGNKSSQTDDIKKAQKYWIDYRSRDDA